MDKNLLFEKLTQLDINTKEAILCRLFGLMETLESKNEQLEPKRFFSLVVSFLK